MRRRVRLLHTSDVHIGGGFLTPKGGLHLDHCLCPIDAIERAAIAHRPDVVIVAGDLFDHQRVSPDLVDEVLHRLDRLDPPCVLISGNHDLHDDRSVYEPTATDRPGLVFLDRTDGTSANLLDGHLSVWGRAMDDHHRGFRPLEGVPERPSGPQWWVVVGHGHHEADEPGAADLPRSSPLTPTEIAATDADYVALGHWHRRADVSVGGVTAWYSGAPHGPGASGLANVVDLHPTRGVTVTPTPVGPAAEGCRRGGAGLAATFIG